MTWTCNIRFSIVENRVFDWFTNQNKEQCKIFCGQQSHNQLSLQKSTLSNLLLKNQSLDNAPQHCCGNWFFKLLKFIWLLSHFEALLLRIRLRAWRTPPSSSGRFSSFCMAFDAETDRCVALLCYRVARRWATNQATRGARRRRRWRPRTRHASPSSTRKTSSSDWRCWASSRCVGSTPSCSRWCKCTAAATSPRWRCACAISSAWCAPSLRPTTSTSRTSASTVAPPRMCLPTTPRPTTTLTSSSPLSCPQHAYSKRYKKTPFSLFRGKSRIFNILDG